MGATTIDRDAAPRSAEHQWRSTSLETTVNLIATLGVFLASWALVIGAVLLAWRLLR
jgi:hypothetical protein